MPVESTNLPINLYSAEQSQAVQNMLQIQDRAQQMVAAAQSQDTGKQEAADQVQISKEVEDKTIEGEGRGAHSFELKKGKEEKKEPPPAEVASPEDPAGRGHRLDIQL